MVRIVFVLLMVFVVSMKMQAHVVLKYPVGGETHHPGETAADHEAQTGSAVSARGRDIRLTERREQPSELLLRHPDARVANRERDPLRLSSVCGNALDLEAHLSILGELARVGQQVE